MLLAMMPPPEAAPLWEIVPVPAEYQACSAPANWGDHIPASGPVGRAVNSIAATADGRVSWNGAPIDDALLRRYAGVVAQLNPTPVTIVYARGLSCERLRTITELIAAEVKCGPDLCVVTFDSPPPPRVLVVPPAPPQPPPPRIGKVLQPISPGSWVTNDDYPAEAIRNQQQGTTGFRLEVDEKGVVTACTVTSSSGSQILDDATCALLKARAKFGHAEDGQGRPIPAVYSNRFRWILPKRDPQPMVSWTDTLRISIGAGGEVISCTPQHFGPVPAWVMPGCEWLKSASRDELRNMRGSATGPVTIVMRADYSASGIAAPAVPALSAAFKPIWGMKMRVEIEPDGHPAACYVDWGHGETAMPADRCAAEGPFESGTDWRTVTAKRTVYTDGDPNVRAALTALTAHIDR